MTPLCKCPIPTLIGSFHRQRLLQLRKRVRGICFTYRFFLVCLEYPERRTKDSYLSSFQMIVESNHAIMIATLSDWLKRLAPVFQPMRSKTKTNRAMYAWFFFFWIVIGSWSCLLLLWLVVVIALVFRESFENRSNCIEIKATLTLCAWRISVTILGNFHGDIISP